MRIKSFTLTICGVLASAMSLVAQTPASPSAERVDWEFVDTHPNEYFIDNDDILEDMAPHYNCSTRFINTGTEPIDFGVEVLYNTVQDEDSASTVWMEEKGWSMSYCVYGHCNVGCPKTDTMDVLEVGDTGFFDFNFYMDHYPETGQYKGYGTGTLALLMFDRFEPEESRKTDTVFITYCWKEDVSECSEERKEPVVGISSIDFGDDVRAYPNPTSGEFTLELGEKALRYDPEVRIYDVSGREVYFNDQLGEKNRIETDYSQGIYFIEVRNQFDDVVVNKLMIRD